MTFAEAQRWQLFIKKRGTLHLGRRVEVAVGRLTHLYAKKNYQGNHTIESYMPHEFTDKPDQGMTFDQLQKVFSKPVQKARK